MDHDELDGLDDLTRPAPALDTGALAPASPPAIERTRRPSVRLGMSVPGAIGGALLVCAIAFGANLGLAGTLLEGGPTPPPAPAEIAMDHDDPVEPTPTPDATDDGVEAGKPTKTTDEVAPTKAPAADPTPTKEPEPDPTKKPAPEPEPTKKPTPKPDPTKEPTPKPTEKPALDLALAAKEGAVLVKWSVCEVDGADYYKVVRSTDSTIKWPTTGSDEVVAAVEVGGTPKAWDEHAPAGKKAWYRVFCVKHSEAGYKVLAASPAKGITAPEATPKPTPKPTPETAAMWLEAAVDGGAVVLHWEACGSDGFSHYRIVRKEGGEGGVIDEIGDQGVTTYVDDAVEPGHTYTYIVQAKGQIDGDWVLLGTTEPVSVTVD